MGLDHARFGSVVHDPMSKLNFGPLQFGLVQSSFQQSAMFRIPQLLHNFQSLGTASSNGTVMLSLFFPLATFLLALVLMLDGINRQQHQRSTIQFIKWGATATAAARNFAGGAINIRFYTALQLLENGVTQK